MKQMSTFILPGMCIVYGCQSNQLRQLFPSLEYEGRQNLSVQFATATTANLLTAIASVYVAVVVFFNQFQF